MPPFPRLTGKQLTTRELDNISPSNPINPDGRALAKMEDQGQRRILRALRDYAERIFAGVTAATAFVIPDRAVAPAVVEPLQLALAEWLEEVAVAGVEFGIEQVGMLMGTRKIFEEVDVGQPGAGIPGEIGFDWALANNDASLWALTHAGELIDGIAKTTKNKLQVDVIQFVHSGQDMPSFIKRVQSSYTFSPARARTIAVTEVTKAYAEGNQAAWTAAGVVEKKAWRTSADERVCPICGPLADVVVLLKDNFPASNGPVKTPPAHPNCRCWIVPEIMRDVTPGLGPVQPAPSPILDRIDDAIRRDRERVAAQGADPVEWYQDGLSPPVARRYDDWAKFNYDDTVSEKIRLAEEMSRRTGIDKDECRRFIHQWAETSNDESFASLDIQRYASEVFNIPLSDWQMTRYTEAAIQRAEILERGQYVLREGGRSIFEDEAGQLLSSVPYKTTGEATKAMINAIYAHTQEELAKAGITEVTLYRGVRLSNIRLTDDLMGKTINITQNTLESWSIDQAVARSFGSIVVEVKVPIADIYSTSRTGIGCLDEWEWVAKNIKGGKVVHIDRGWQEDAPW